jgi:hypothetical protein
MESMAWDSLFEMRNNGHPLYVVDARNGVVRKFHYADNCTSTECTFTVIH